jgi:hypothetical protein
MHGNTNFEFKSTTRKERNARPPRGEQAEQKPTQKRGKQWSRDNDKREQSEFFNSYQ